MLQGGEYGGNQERKESAHTQQTNLVCLGESKGFSVMSGAWIGIRRDEVAFIGGDSRRVPT